MLDSPFQIGTQEKEEMRNEARKKGRKKNGKEGK